MTRVRDLSPSRLFRLKSPLHRRSGSRLGSLLGGLAVLALSTSALAQESPAPVAASPAQEEVVAPSEAEQKALDSIKGKIPGFIVFESNRDGEWHLYRMNADGTDLRKLTSTPRDNGGEPMYAAISPDGQTIAWEHRYTSQNAEIWLMNSDGTNQRPLYAPAGNKDTRGYRPAWTPDGRLTFARSGTRLKQTVWVYDFKKQAPKVGLVDKLMDKEPALAKGQQSWQEEKLADFRETEVPFHVKRILVHEMAPDLKNFVAWCRYPVPGSQSTGSRGVYWMTLDGKKQEKIHGGCSPRVMPDGKNFIWVIKAGKFGIGSFTEPVQSQLLFGGPYPEIYDHGYFPYLTDDYKYLVFSACPFNQHDQETSNYQLFITPMEDLKPVGQPVRLSFNKATDRYPVMWYEGMTSPAEPPTIKGDAHKIYDGPDDTAEDEDGDAADGAAAE